MSPGPRTVVFASASRRFLPPEVEQDDPRESIWASSFSQVNSALIKELVLRDSRSGVVQSGSFSLLPGAARGDFSPVFTASGRVPGGKTRTSVCGGREPRHDQVLLELSSQDRPHGPPALHHTTVSPRRPLLQDAASAWPSLQCGVGGVPVTSLP